MLLNLMVRKMMEEHYGNIREQLESLTLFQVCTVLYTVKKVSDFPVPSRDVRNQTHLGRD
jgi:delta-aminolevulinic acid dehydratase/porphobilinogen synthase